MGAHSAILQTILFTKRRWLSYLSFMFQVQSICLFWLEHFTCSYNQVRCRAFHMLKMLLFISFSWWHDGTTLHSLNGVIRWSFVDNLHLCPDCHLAESSIKVKALEELVITTNRLKFLAVFADSKTLLCPVHGIFNCLRRLFREFNQDESCVDNWTVNTSHWESRMSHVDNCKLGPLVQTTRKLKQILVVQMRIDWKEQ